MKPIGFKNFLFLPIGGSSVIRVNFRVATGSKRSVAIARYFRTEAAWQDLSAVRVHPFVEKYCKR